MNYHDFIAVFVKQCKTREHGGFLQSRSHIYLMLAMISAMISFNFRVHGKWLLSSTWLRIMYIKIKKIFK